MTDCPNCKTASERAWHPGTTGCMVCEARRISCSPACHAAEQAGYITPAYRAELEAVGGNDMHWRVMHALVLAWQHRDARQAAWSR